MRSTSLVSQAELKARYLALELALRGSVDPAELLGHASSFVRTADLRFYGQAYELSIAVGADDSALEPARLHKAFVEEHVRTYGHGLATDRADIVNIRVALHLDKELPTNAVAPTDSCVQVPLLDTAMRIIYFGAATGLLATPVITRHALGADPVDGPLVIEELHSTVLVPPTWSVRVAGESSFILDKHT